MSSNENIGWCNIIPKGELQTTDHVIQTRIQDRIILSPFKAETTSSGSKDSSQNFRIKEENQTWPNSFEHQSESDCFGNIIGIKRELYEDIIDIQEHSLEEGDSKISDLNSLLKQPTFKFESSGDTIDVNEDIIDVKEHILDLDNCDEKTDESQDPTEKEEILTSKSENQTVKSEPGSSTVRIPDDVQQAARFEIDLSLGTNDYDVIEDVVIDGDVIKVESSDEEIEIVKSTKATAQTKKRQNELKVKSHYIIMSPGA